MMWAATVRRCPTGHSRHPSQFGARLQLARALTHAPYLICDGVYSCPPSLHTPYNSDLNLPYRTSFGEANSVSEPSSLCDHVIDCDNRNQGHPYINRPVYTQGVYATARHCCNNSLTNSVTGSACMPRGRFIQEVDEVRVELPYSRRDLEQDEDYPLSERIIRRYDDIQGRDEGGDEGIVGLSYQQRSMGNNGPYGGEVWGTEPSLDCWGDRPLLLNQGKTRELVRTMFVVALSFTLVTFVMMGFEQMYSVLMTTVFILFLLTTLSLLMFLVMRKPACFSCCNDSLHETNNISERSDTQQHQQQQGLTAYLTESQSVILKKKLSDSPPPYESPPDYHSLPPEILVNARGLGGLEAPAENMVIGVHGEEQSSYCQRDFSIANVKYGRLRSLTSRSSSSLLSSAAPFLSSSKSSPARSSLPASPALCTASEFFNVSLSRKTQNDALSNHPNLTPSSSPPPYECIVLQTETPKSKIKPC